MLIYNKKLYLRLGEIDEFEIYTNPEMNLKCFRKIFQSKDEWYIVNPETNQIYKYDKERFMRNASNLLMFALGKTFVNSEIIYTINLREFCYYLTRFYAEQSENPSVHLNYNIKVLGNEFSKLTFEEFLIHDRCGEFPTDLECISEVLVEFTEKQIRFLIKREDLMDCRKDAFNLFTDMIEIAGKGFLIKMNQYLKIKKQMDEEDYKFHEYSVADISHITDEKYLEMRDKIVNEAAERSDKSKVIIKQLKNVTDKAFDYFFESNGD